MFGAGTRRKSLSVYTQAALSKQRLAVSGVASSTLASPMSTISTSTAATTVGYNTETTAFLDQMHAKMVADHLRYGRITGPLKAARDMGVKRAWEYETQEIRMGGSGTANWDPSQRQEILTQGRARGAEGHHLKNVANHPEEQYNPNNVAFARDKAEHLNKYHKGDFHNETDAPLLDRDGRIRNVNSRRVNHNEMRGLGIAVAIGLGVGFGLSFILTLAQNGISPDSLKMAAAEGVRGGLEVGGLAVVGYGVSRCLGQLAANSLNGALQNAGVALAGQISQALAQGIAGMLTIAVFSTYQFIKLRIHGIGTKQALFQVARGAIVSLSLLAVGIALQSIFGGHIGLAFQIGVTLAWAAVTLIQTGHQKVIADKVRICAIEYGKPAFA